MFNYEELKNKREEMQKAEEKEMYMYHWALKGQRKRYEAAEHLLHFQEDQNQCDTLLLHEKFLEWLNKAKKGSEQEKVLNNMINALVRINAYTMTIESAAKNAVGDYLRDKDIVKNYQNDKRALELQIMRKELEIEEKNREIESLKKQLDFK